MTPEEADKLMQKPNHVFVFGSNLAGRHGKGAARTANQQYGAKYGVGVGFTGRCYAIPTKDEKLRTLPLSDIRTHVEQFLKYAANNKEVTFVVTAIGCGLAGYSPEQIAPMFKNKTSNVILPNQFIEHVV